MGDQGRASRPQTDSSGFTAFILLLGALTRMETTNDAQHDPVFEQSLGHADSPTSLDTKTHRKIAKRNAVLEASNFKRRRKEIHQ